MFLTRLSLHGILHLNASQPCALKDLLRAWKGNCVACGDGADSRSHFYEHFIVTKHNGVISRMTQHTENQGSHLSTMHMGSVVLKYACLKRNG